VLLNPLARLSELEARVAVRPADGLVVRVTVPAKPLTLLRAIGVVHVAPALQLTVTVVAGEIEKSLKLNVAVAEWDSVPLMPVTVTVNVPAVVEVQDSVAVPELVRLVGDTEQVGPVALVESATVPVNPLTAVTVTVEVAVVVPSAGAAAGVDALIVKLVTWNAIAPVEWLSVPLTPVTTTL
jgi:hypothetical protein